MKFRELTYQKRVLFDGGLGSMLYRRGMQREDVPELFTTLRPDVVTQIHREYAQAGADVVTTNSLGANALALKRHNLENRLEELVEAAVRAAREGIGDKGCVALSVGPTGGMMKPFGPLSSDEVYEAYRRQIVAGANAGADVIYMETMGDIAETRIAALAAKENADIPFCCSFNYSNGAMLTGGSPECAALVCEGIGALAVAANCIAEPAEIAKIIARSRAVSRLPFIAMPNAGLPEIVDGNAVYRLGATEMAEKMRVLLEADATGIGGCCGTTPEHIAAFRKILDENDALPPPSVPQETYICSTRRHVPLQTALKNAQEISADPDLLYEIEPGAQTILVDFKGASAADIESFMEEAAIATHLPFCFRFARDEQARAVLRRYPGIAGVTGNVAEETRRAYGAVAAE